MLWVDCLLIAFYVFSWFVWLVGVCLNWFVVLVVALGLVIWLGGWVVCICVG